MELLLFSIFLLLPISANSANITLGSSLSATENSSPWLSDLGDFAFGFQQLKGQSDLFLLCIWYAKIPDKTIVWYASTDQPVPRQSKLNLTSDQGLVLTSLQGQELWKSELLGLGDVSHGVMSVSGSFVLQSSSSETLWESFQVPSDTLLPSQVIKKGGKLSSRQSETNYSKGRFQLRLQQDGNLVLNSINLPTDYANSPYYDTKTTDGTVPGSAGKQLVFNQSGYLYVLRENEGRFGVVDGNIVSARDNYLRATLNFDGTFVLYYHPKSWKENVSWTRSRSIPDNICQSLVVEAGAGVCGHNSICEVNSDEKPTCRCPKGYSFLDPNDVYGHCKADFIQGCKEDELSLKKDLYEVVELPNVDWPTSDYVMLKPFNGDACKESCLQDCMCSVAIFRDGTCWKKKLPLLNGRVDSSLNARAFIKVRKDNSTLPSGPPNPDKKKENQDKKKENQDTLIIVGSVLLGTSAFVNLILIFSFCLGSFVIYKKKQEPVTLNLHDTNLKCFTYKELEGATQGFKEELGRGAFGIVYKGNLQTGSNSGVFVAVKKLTFVAQETEKEFRNEVTVIGQTHHKNLVRLLGYCDDEQHRLLVYEYLSNGTLASFLFGDSKPVWNQRMEIAVGIARGILYLHEECSTQIIHCDIKPQNILLDEYNQSKISDFGLAKLLMMNQSHTHTNIRGTKGYVAPEWFRNMAITAKVDVYSFGVVLLEIVCCRRSVDMEDDDEAKAILTDWAYDCYRDGALEALVDWDSEALDDRKKLERYVMVSMWCIQENPALRPNMRKVVQMLEGIVEVQVPPCPSPYSRTTTITI
ncbi:hypothetical protein UlMin_029671 [Ulmus minor]